MYFEFSSTLDVVLGHFTGLGSSLSRRHLSWIPRHCRWTRARPRHRPWTPRRIYQYYATWRMLICLHGFWSTDDFDLDHALDHEFDPDDLYVPHDLNDLDLSVSSIPDSPVLHLGSTDLTRTEYLHNIWTELVPALTYVGRHAHDFAEILSRSISL